MKTICDLVLKEKVNYIEIDRKKYEIEDVTVAEITKHKNNIISSALECLNDKETQQIDELLKRGKNVN